MWPQVRHNGCFEPSEAIRTESCHDSFPAGQSASEGGFLVRGRRLEKSFDARESVIAGEFSRR